MIRLQVLFAKFKKNMTAKTVVLFAFTFVTAGTLIFFFEHEKGNKDQFVNIWDGIWWGIVTITTTGYGDKYPATLGGRIVAGITMCTGIVSAGIVTGNIASWLVDRKLKESRGILNLSTKSGHLVICGWRREMAIVIEEVLKLDAKLKVSDIVIVAPITPETLEAFQSDERFRGVSVVRGEYYTQPMLHRAGVKKARKVLVLSDWSNDAQSLTSIDAKTVMTAMTIRKMAPEVYLAAEILDAKFEPYLRLSQCDEVLQSKEYGRVLMTRFVTTRGMGHILYELLNADTPTVLATIPIPTGFVGEPFERVRSELRKSGQGILIGLLENTGSLHRMKKEALTAAQKNPDTREVLRNIRQVKALLPNHPVLNPKRDYAVKNNSLAIVVVRRQLGEKFS